MKTILVLVVVAVAALIAFNYLTTGELKIIPSSQPTGEAAVLRNLDRELHAAFDAYDTAQHGSDYEGSGTEADLRYYGEQIDAIEIKLKNLKEKTKSIEVRGEADKLLDEITQHRMDSR